MRRLLIYYALMVPGMVVLLFCPPAAQLVSLLFLLLCTVLLPQTGEFLWEAAWRFPAFLLLSATTAFVFLGSLNLISFLARFSDYAALLALGPAYAAFRLLTLPWTFVGEGLSAPLVSLEVPNRKNWLVLAAVSALALAERLVPYSLLFLAAPASFYLFNNLGLSPALSGGS